MWDCRGQVGRGRACAAQMGDDVVDDGVVGDETQDAQAARAGWTGQGLDLGHMPEQFRPGESACASGRGVVAWGLLVGWGVRVGGECMDVGIERQVLIEALQGQDDAWGALRAVGDDADDIGDGAGGGACEVGEESSVKAEVDAQALGDGEYDLAVRYGEEDCLDEVGSSERGGAGGAGRAQPSAAVGSSSGSERRRLPSAGGNIAPWCLLRRNTWRTFDLMKTRPSWSC